MVQMPAVQAGMLAPMRRFVSAVLVAALPALAGAASAAEVNLYTTREPGLIRPLLDAFTAASGVRVNTVFVDKGLAERVVAEGARSPADVLMTVDIGNLVDLVDKGATQPLRSEVLASAVPENLRDPQGHWYALSLRARVVYADPALGDATPTRYEDLADPRLKGKICIRPGQHPYNTALTAAFLAHHGEAKTQAWLEGVKANLARKPSGGDREVARDIKAGLCQVGLGNSYYVGLMRSGRGGPDQRSWGEAIKVVLPTFAEGGTHVNVSGAAVARSAPNKAEAVRLLEYLVSDEAQHLYAASAFEFPVKAGAKADPIIAALGTLAVDRVSLGEVARGRKLASTLAERVGFDD